MRKIGIFLFAMGFVWSSAQKKWTLQECVDYAVKSNLQVRQNEYNKTLQDANLSIAKKEKLPSISANISNNAAFGTQLFANQLVRNDNFNNNASIGANVLIYNNGRLEKTVRKTEFDVEAAKYDIETVKNNISLQIVQEYLSVLLNKEIVKINRSTLENTEKQYLRAKLTTEAGTTPQTTLAEAEAAVAREKQNLKSAEVNVNQGLFNLAQLLMLPDFKGFDIQDVNVESKMLPALGSAEDVLEKAYENQPQIKAAESRIKSAETQTKIAKTAFWPTVSASAGLGTVYFNDFNSNTDADFFRQYSGNFGQQLGLTANIPIFNKGITKLQVEQSKINEDISKNSLLQQKQEVRQNVQQAQFQAESNFEIYTAALEAEKSSGLALDFAEKSYEAGKTSIYDLNTARNNYANAQGNVAQAKFNYLFSLKLLDFYAGIPLGL
ncbi:MAG: TolC family protein [Flavobacteriaceae bacterium]|jgi:outer membrane protein|nr:TolC family protein [Flavobacteriaceae bacterium]